MGGMERRVYFCVDLSLVYSSAEKKNTRHGEKNQKHLKIEN